MSQDQDDGLKIPDFLKISADERRRSWDDWERNNPRRTVALLEPPKITAPDVTAFLAEQAERRKVKTSNRVKQLRGKQASTPFDPATMRWDPGRGKFVTDPFMVQAAARAKAEGKPVAAPVVKVRAVKGAVDDLGEQVIRLTTRDGKFDPVALRWLAELNGVWDERLVQLNNGLQRMNVVNRLRRKVKDGYKTVWEGKS